MCLLLPVFFSYYHIKWAPGGPSLFRVRVHKPYTTAPTDLFVAPRGPLESGAPRSAESQRIGVTPLTVPLPSVVEY